MIVYRITLNVAIYGAARLGKEGVSDEENITAKFSTYIVSVTGAILNLIIILILNAVSKDIPKYSIAHRIVPL